MSSVAEAAGVSLTTVSHVLNRTRHVRAETRARVLEAAEALGYYDMRVARARETKLTIGVVLPAMSSPYFGELIDSIDAEAARAGATLLLSASGESPAKEASAVRALLDRNVDAMIVVPTAGWRDRTRPLLRDARVATVLADRLEDRGFDQVGSENTLATRRLIEHLITAGHDRIGMITGLTGLSTSRERETGFRLAHEGAGLDVDPALIWDGRSTVRGGYAAAEEMLRGPNPPSAVFCGNNNMTMGLLGAIRRERVRVPSDLAVVAFDDLEWADIVSPSVTSIAQPFHAMGSRAVQMALQRLGDQRREPRTIRLPASIEHRESCGCHTPVAA
ncbi:LacI family DNA-binding transcriptional regulator [Actinoplanes sp. LDG1-06]|uniref:LacI family DNA-binding transcriptional regulator n=1 Tax=Paractinoplanes ovalisporus TaxID=2810368 RepID=A0ABS2AEK5_9ACTN|nr:LacI family DNA-binding transcriptional regulator [Actinoplanes ovalisporus]MBM2618270.1 LacI family DNA-binding transcriptional regulator [Actinoplanes ovalisporus]